MDYLMMERGWWGVSNNCLSTSCSIFSGIFDTDGLAKCSMDFLMVEKDCFKIALILLYILLIIR